MEHNKIYIKNIDESLEEFKILLIKYKDQHNAKEVHRIINLFKKIIEWLLVRNQGDIKISAIDGKIGTKFRFDNVYHLPN